jgi:MraZ protein
MLFFTGTYLHSLDDRGRIAVPAKLREKLGAEVAVTNGRGACLAIFPLDVWQVTANRVLSEPNVSDSDNDMRLFTFGDAWEGPVDNQGRIALPDYLRDAAGLTGEVAVVGAGDHVQIWDKQAWINRRAELRRSPPNLAGQRSGGRSAT